MKAHKPLIYLLAEFLQLSAHSDDTGLGYLSDDPAGLGHGVAYLEEGEAAPRSDDVGLLFVQLQSEAVADVGDNRVKLPELLLRAGYVAVVHIPLVVLHSVDVLDCVVEVVRDDQSHVLRYLTAERRAGGFVVLQFLVSSAALLCVRDERDVLRLVHFDEVHRQAFEHFVLSCLAEFLSAEAVPDTVEVAGEVVN